MTAEQLQDALGLLPMELIEEADALRRKPKKKPIPFRRWGALAACAVLVLGCGMFAVRSGLLPLAGGGKSEAAMDKVAMQECAPEAPAAPAEEECDCAESIILPDEENRLMPTIGTPPVDIDSAQYRYGELSVFDEVHLLKKVDDLEALGLEPDIYDEDWFADFDLLLIALPGITSHERLDISVGQGADPFHWEIRIANMPEDRVDWAESLLICIPVHKGHIPKDTEFDLIWE